MVFPPNADETGGSPRSAAPIHRVVCGLDLPVVDHWNPPNRLDVRGTDKGGFGEPLRILVVLPFF